MFYEYQDWEEIPAAEAHQLHHQGHDAHDKQDEEAIHTILTGHVERLDVNVDIPYVTRHFIEIDSHAHLGENQTSQGLGDITITGDYRFIQNENKAFGVIAGIKVPSGKTDEHNSFGGLVEPELQPGSGSVDYIAGLSGSLHPQNWDLSANAIYIYKTEGEQEFRSGNVFSVSMFAGKNFDLNKKLHLKTGLMMNHQLEQKENTDEGAVKDSGGYTMLIGPQVSLGCDSVEVEFSYLAPAVQNLGGTHQTLDNGIWTGSMSVKF